MNIEQIRRIYRETAKLLGMAILQSFCISLIVACSPSSTSLPNVENEQSEATISSISYLKGLYNGQTYYISSDIIIEGIITANNAFGEFPESIVIEDTSGAIEVMCDIDCTSYGFTIGATVRVICSGLYLGSVGGMLSLGGAPYDQTPTSTLSEEEVISHVRICDDEVVEILPTQTTISELTTSHILRYVLIKSIHFILSQDSSLTFCSRDEESGQTQHTTHILADEQGEQIPLYVDREVEYADATLPLNSFDISAIVEYFNGEYSLRITNRGYSLYE